ncbi:MAG: Ribonuclease VapC3 [Candidatus Bathyarchaeota archaeon BA1]|nr:MAG: Ribonuclease VapC3 [Candidatus Bathyarchaeota archaeon BA1]
MAGLKRNMVIDASVVMKWFIQEKDRDRALMLREKHVRGERLLLAPDLLAYEVCDSLRYNPEFTDGDVRDAVKALFELHLGLSSPTIRDMDKASENAFKYDITVYDASYLSLADLEESSLITADEKLYEKVKENPLVVLLSSDKFLQIII